MSASAPSGNSFTIDDQKNVVGVRREPGGSAVGEFCVRVAAATGLQPDGNNLTVVVSASDAGFTASSKPWVGNACDDDEMVIATYNATGTLADSGFSAVLP